MDRFKGLGAAKSAPLATDRQLAALERFGMAAPRGLTKAAASEMISFYVKSVGGEASRIDNDMFDLCSQSDLF